MITAAKYYKKLNYRRGTARAYPCTKFDDSRYRYLFSFSRSRDM